MYAGYVDDPRNTDNAWMETVVFNFHDDTGSPPHNTNLAPIVQTKMLHAWNSTVSQCPIERFIAPQEMTPPLPPSLPLLSRWCVQQATAPCWGWRCSCGLDRNPLWPHSLRQPLPLHTPGSETQECCMVGHTLLGRTKPKYRRYIPKKTEYPIYV